MNWAMGVWKVAKGIFSSGSATGGKSIVTETADIVDNYRPGEVTKHKMAVEDVKVGDESQSAARKYEPQVTGTDWFNRIVDGLNRLPRPLFTFWAFGELAGILPTPAHLNNVNPIVMNIIWTVIGFYFGVRTISQDLPKAVNAWYKIREMIKNKA